MGIFSKVIDAALESKAWENISKNVIGKIDIRLGDPKIKPSDFHFVRECLRDTSSIFAFASAELNRPGHILQNLLFREKYTHAGLVIPEILDPYAARAIHIDTEGLHTEPFIDVLSKCDRFCLVKLPIPRERLSEAHERIRAIVARKPEYDTAFKLRDNSKLFCSEIIWDVGQGLITDPDFKSKWIGGKETFLPDVVPSLGEIIAER
jgi:hypothetical protein